MNICIINNMNFLHTGMSVFELCSSERKLPDKLLLEIFEYLPNEQLWNMQLLRGWSKIILL